MQHQFDTSSLGIEGLGWCAVSTGHIQPPSTGRKGQLHFTISIQYLLAIIHSEGFITQSCGFRLRISFANESGHWRSHSLLRQHTPTRQSWQPASMPGSLEPTHNLEGPSSPHPRSPEARWWLYSYPSFSLWDSICLSVCRKANLESFVLIVFNIL